MKARSPDPTDTHLATVDPLARNATKVAHKTGDGGPVGIRRINKGNSPFWSRANRHAAKYGPPGATVKGNAKYSYTVSKSRTGGRVATARASLSLPVRAAGDPRNTVVVANSGTD